MQEKLENTVTHLGKTYLKQTLIPVIFIACNSVTVRIRVIHFNWLWGVGS